MSAAVLPDPVAGALSVICFLFDPNTGGPTIRARAVYERMMADGHQVRVAFPRGEGSAAGYLAERGIPVDRLDIARPAPPSKPGAFARFALSFPVGLWRTVRYLRARRPDVVHVNGAFDMGPALAGRLAGVPVVWHLNDTLFGARVSRLLGRLVRRTATVVVAAAGRVAEHYGVADVARTIFAPVDVARFTPRPARAARAGPVIGLLANWNRLKGQDRFVEAIARLRADGRPVRGRAMGRLLDSQRGFWEPVLARLAADPELDAAIERTGFVDDVATALADLDILVLTSLSEASPIVVLEAMAVGLPQVVFDVGGVREMLGEGGDVAGIVVPAGDVAALVAAIGRVLDDPDLYAALAAAGPVRARERFSLEACIERHLAAYRAAIAGGAA